MARSVGLQIGRIGDPWRTWSVEPRPGEHWAVDVDLPIDAGFVGLRGTPELERVIGRIAFVPIAVVDETRRPRLPPVMAATSVEPAATSSTPTRTSCPRRPGSGSAAAATTTVIVHRTDAERTAAAAAQQRPDSESPAHSTTSGWSKTVVLEPQQPGEVEIPVENRSLVTLELAAEFEFVPRELDPTSSDPALRWASGSNWCRHEGCLRREYASQSLDERTADRNPIAQFRAWFDEVLAGRCSRSQRDEPGHGLARRRAVGAHRAAQGG